MYAEVVIVYIRHLHTALGKEGNMLVSNLIHGDIFSCKSVIIKDKLPVKSCTISLWPMC